MASMGVVPFFFGSYSLLRRRADRSVSPLLQWRVGVHPSRRSSRCAPPPPWPRFPGPSSLRLCPSSRRRDAPFGRPCAFVPRLYPRRRGHTPWLVEGLRGG